MDKLTNKPDINEIDIFGEALSSDEDVSLDSKNKLQKPIKRKKKWERFTSRRLQRLWERHIRDYRSMFN